MFSVNDLIQYGAQGVCRIIAIEEKEFMKKRANYYILKPLYQTNDSTIFVPVDSEKLVAKMRKILSQQDIDQMLQFIHTADPIWIEDENTRKETYQTILTSGDRTRTMQMIKTLYLHKQEREKEGKKLHICDERFMKEAETLLYNEFAVVLHIKPEEVLPFILQEMQ